MKIDACDLLLKLVGCLVAPQGAPSTKKPRLITSRPAPIFGNLEEVLASIQARLADQHLVCSLEVVLLATDDLLRILASDETINRALTEAETLLLETSLGGSKIAFARRKMVFLRACTGRQDQASVDWFDEAIPALRATVEKSICSQTVRIETDRMISENSDERPSRPNNLPDWRNIVKSKLSASAVRQLEKPLVEVLDQ